MSLKLKWKLHKAQGRIEKLIFKIWYRIVWKIIPDDVIEEYAIDSQMLEDYYNEQRDY